MIPNVPKIGYWVLPVEQYSWTRQFESSKQKFVFFPTFFTWIRVYDTVCINDRLITDNNSKHLHITTNIFDTHTTAKLTQQQPTQMLIIRMNRTEPNTKLPSAFGKRGAYIKSVFTYAGSALNSIQFVHIQIDSLESVNEQLQLLCGS